MIGAADGRPPASPSSGPLDESLGATVEFYRGV